MQRLLGFLLFIQGTIQGVLATRDGLMSRHITKLGEFPIFSGLRMHDD